MKACNWRALLFTVLLLELFILPVQAQDTSWGPHLNHVFHFAFEMPNGISLVGQTNYYQDADMSLNIDAVANAYERDTLRGTCDAVARVRQGRGQLVKATNLNYCLIEPGANSGQGWAAVIAYPTPINLTMSTGTVSTFRYLLLSSTAGYIRRIAESVTFPDVPPADLFVKSALELLQSFWYYRREVDWQAVEAQALRKLTDEPNIDKNYLAIQAAIEDLRIQTGDHHLSIVTSERAGVQQRGASIGLGVLASGDGEIFFVFPDSPAEEAGLRPLDRIETVNGIPREDFTGYKPGTYEVTLTISRPNVAEPLEVIVGRGTYAYYVPSRGRAIGDVGYLETFGFDGNLADIQQYATETQEQIREADRDGVCGWVVDTRRNIGGRFAPLFSAVGPILGDSDILQLLDTHAVAQVISYADGELQEGPDLIEHMVDNPYTVRRPHPPVALLVSRNSASAGEMTPMLFLNREEAATRIFGEQTYGLTSAIHYFDLYDGGKLQITTHRAADRAGQTYPEGIVPDVPIAVNFDAAVYGTDDDPVLQAALDWLNQQPGCSN